MVNKTILLIVVIFCLFIFLYVADIPELYFLNDDSRYIPVSTNFKFLYGTSFRPVSDLTLLMDYSLWGNRAPGYHFTNFFLHLFATVLFFFLTDKIFTKYNNSKAGSFKSLTASILFFFYPFHSEPLFWILGRGGLLGALFGIASLLCYLSRDKSRWYLGSAVLLFLIGAFAYETIWIVPLVVIIITFFDVKLLPQRSRFLIRDAVIFWMFFLLYIIVRSKIIGEIGGSPYGSSAIIKFDTALLIKNYFVMTARSFLPPMQSNILLGGLYFLLVLLIAGFFRKLIVQKRLSKSMLISISCFLISFVPVLSLGVNSHDSESERFLYFPSVFAVLLVTDIGFELFKSNTAKIVFFSTMFCAEVFYLAQAAEPYQISSKMSRLSMEVIDSLGAVAGKLYCIDLPTQYKGGLIYRSGFEQSVAWLAGKNKAVIVKVSSRAIISPTMPYTVKHVDMNELPIAEAALILKQLSAKQFSPANDVILKWTDSSLLILK